MTTAGDLVDWLSAIFARGAADVRPQGIWAASRCVGRVASSELTYATSLRSRRANAGARPQHARNASARERTCTRESSHVPFHELEPAWRRTNAEPHLLTPERSQPQQPWAWRDRLRCLHHDRSESRQHLCPRQHLSVERSGDNRRVVMGGSGVRTWRSNHGFRAVPGAACGSVAFSPRGDPSSPHRALSDTASVSAGGRSRSSDPDDDTFTAVTSGGGSTTTRPPRRVGTPSPPVATRVPRLPPWDEALVLQPTRFGRFGVVGLARDEALVLQPTRLG
jgi:hypothetical protein